MFSLRGFGILIVTSISVLAVESSCGYKLKITKAGPCASNKDPVVALENFDMNFSDDECGLQISGCIKMQKDVNEIEVKYKGFKDGLPVISGTKQGCGFREEKGEFEVKCPLKKGDKLCPGNSVLPLPGGEKTAGMAKGSLKAMIELIADGKKYCYEGMGNVTPT